MCCFDYRYGKFTCIPTLIGVIIFFSGSIKIFLSYMFHFRSVEITIKTARMKMIEMDQEMIGTYAYTFRPSSPYPDVAHVHLLTRSFFTYCKADMIKTIHPTMRSRLTGAENAGTNGRMKMPTTMDARGKYNTYLLRQSSAH